MRFAAGSCDPGSSATPSTSSSSARSKMATFASRCACGLIAREPNCGTLSSSGRMTSTIRSRESFSGERSSSSSIRSRDSFSGERSSSPLSRASSSISGCTISSSTNGCTSRSESALRRRIDEIDEIAPSVDDQRGGPLSASSASKTASTSSSLSAASAASASMAWVMSSATSFSPAARPMSDESRRIAPERSDDPSAAPVAASGSARAWAVSSGTSAGSRRTIRLSFELDDALASPSSTASCCTNSGLLAEWCAGSGCGTGAGCSPASGMLPTPGKTATGVEKAGSRAAAAAYGLAGFERDASMITSGSEETSKTSRDRCSGRWAAALAPGALTSAITAGNETSFANSSRTSSISPSTSSLSRRTSSSSSACSAISSISVSSAAVSASCRQVALWVVEFSVRVLRTRTCR